MGTIVEQFENMIKKEKNKEKVYDISEYEEFLQEMDKVGLKKDPKYTLPVGVTNFGTIYKNKDLQYF